MKAKLKDILVNYFNEEDKYGQDYAVATLLSDLANLADLDINAFLETED